MESVGSEYQGRVTVVAVDASADPETARALGACAVPLLVALRDGRERARRVGAAAAADVRAVYAAALAGLGGALPALALLSGRPVRRSSP